MDTDAAVSKWLYTNIGMKTQIPKYLGEIPYEIYTFPFMFISIAMTFYYETLTLVQVHLLPLWAAYSISSYLKGTFKRLRPACNSSLNMSKLIKQSYCKFPKKFQSFPSGHAILSCSLGTSLILYVQEEFKQNAFLFITIILIVKLNVLLHRVAYGFHYVSDVLAGSLIGCSIGYMSYKLLNDYRKSYVERKPKSKTYNVIKQAIILLCVIGVIHYFLYKFPSIVG